MPPDEPEVPVEPAPAPEGTPTPPEAPEGTPPGTPTPPEDATPPAPPATPQAKTKPGPEPWVQRRIDQLARERAENFQRATNAEARAKILEAQLAQLQGTAPTPTQPRTYSEAEVRAVASQEAARIAAQSQFNRECQNILDEGRREFDGSDHGSFEVALSNFQKLGGIPTEFLYNVVELGTKDAARVLYELSMDPDEASRIIHLTGAKQAVALDRYARKGEAVTARAPSKAPAPIRTVSGASVARNPSLYDDRLPTEDWVALRNKEIKDRRSRA